MMQHYNTSIAKWTTTRRRHQRRACMHAFGVERGEDFDDSSTLLVISAPVALPFLFCPSPNVTYFSTHGFASLLARVCTIVMAWHSSRTLPATRIKICMPLASLQSSERKLGMSFVTRFDPLSSGQVTQHVPYRNRRSI